MNRHLLPPGRLKQPSEERSSPEVPVDKVADKEQERQIRKERLAKMQKDLDDSLPKPAPLETPT